MVKLKSLIRFLLPLMFLFLVVPFLMADATIVAQVWIPLGTDPSGDTLFAGVADSEQSGDAGEVWKGDYTYTHKSDDKREYLRETKVGCGYQLKWIYNFTWLPSRNDTDFYIEGRTTEDDITENMTVRWSRSSNGPWYFLGNVTTAPERVYGPWDIPDETASTIYIRIKDTIETGDKRSGILVDHMYIACVMDGADKTELYFYNDGVYAYFNETLAATPDPSSFTYTVYLDKPAGGTYSQDFRLVYSAGTAELQGWNGSDWNYLGDITVTVDGSSIVFKVLLQSIANPKIQENTNVWFVEYFGSNSYDCKVDRAPNTGSYFISYEVIPNLPWPTPLVFMLAAVTTVYLIHKQRFKRNG